MSGFEKQEAAASNRFKVHLHPKNLPYALLCVGGGRSNQALPQPHAAPGGAPPPAPPSRRLNRAAILPGGLRSPVRLARAQAAPPAVPGGPCATPAPAPTAKYSPGGRLWAGTRWEREARGRERRRRALLASEQLLSTAGAWCLWLHACEPWCVCTPLRVDTATYGQSMCINVYDRCCVHSAARGFHTQGGLRCATQCLFHRGLRVCSTMPAQRSGTCNNFPQWYVHRGAGMYGPMRFS